jgi:hypothetical protein
MTGNRILLWLCVPLYYLAVFSKEHAIMLPLCILALTVLFYKDWAQQLRREAAFFAVLFFMAFMVFYFRKSLIGSLYEPNASGYLYGVNAGEAYFFSVISQSALFFKYIFLWLLPNTSWMSIDMREDFATRIFSLQSVCFVIYLMYGLFGVKLLMRKGLTGLIGFSILFPWVMFLTEFSAVRIQEIFVLYRSYLWSFGWFLMLAIVLLKVGAKKSRVILGAVILTLTMLSLERMQTMAHPVILWDDAAKLVEGKSQVIGGERIYYNRGTERAKLGQFEGAKSDFYKAIAIYPDHVDARANLGSLYFQAGQWQNAIDQFNDLEKVGATQKAYLHPRLIFGRAVSYAKLGQVDRAQKDFIKSCELSKLGCEFVRR